MLKTLTCGKLIHCIEALLSNLITVKLTGYPDFRTVLYIKLALNGRRF